MLASSAEEAKANGIPTTGIMPNSLGATPLAMKPVNAATELCFICAIACAADIFPSDSFPIHLAPSTPQQAISTIPFIGNNFEINGIFFCSIKIFIAAAVANFSP